MAELKMLFEHLGLASVSTYIQSGNVIFQSDQPASLLVERIEKAIQNEYNFEVPVQVIAANELIKIAEESPYAGNSNINSLHLTLLEKEPEEKLVASIVANAASSDVFQIQGRAIYLHCPDGYGRTKLTNTFFESKLKMKATTRNWKTVLKVIELTQQMEQ